MTPHIIQAKKISLQNWILFDLTSGETIGEERAYRYTSRSDAYIAASQMWPENSVWHGKRVSNGYTIEVGDPK